MEVQKEKGSFATKHLCKGSYIPCILKWFEAKKAHNPQNFETQHFRTHLSYAATGSSPMCFTKWTYQVLRTEWNTKVTTTLALQNPGSERIQPSLKQVCVFQEDK